MVSHRRSWLGTLGTIAVVLLLVPLLGLLGTAPAGAASNGSWSVYPTTTPGHAPRVVFSPDLVPGKTVGDSVTVSNISGSPLTFELFAADAFNTPGGGLSLRRKVDPVEGIGAWIHLAHSAVTVPAHASAAIGFLIAVPPDATPGDHVGGIVAEETTGTPASAGSVPINVIQAVGVRVYGRVRGPLVTRLGVTKPHVAIDKTTAALFGASTSAVVTVQVANRGNVVLTPLAHLKVTSALENPSSRTFTTGPLLPGEEVTRRFTFSVRALGSLDARVSVTASKVHASEVTMQWSWPWGLIGLVLLVLVLVVLTLVRWSLRRHRRKSKTAAADEAAASEPNDVEELAASVEDAGARDASGEVDRS